MWPIRICRLLASSLLASAVLYSQSANDREYIVPRGEIFNVTLDHSLNLAHVHPGDVLEGQVFEPVFVYDREVVPAKSRVRVVVEEVTRERVHEIKKGFIDRLDAARGLGLDRKYDYQVKLRSAEITLPNAAPRSVQLNFLQGGEIVEVHAKGDELRLGETTESTLAHAAPGVGRYESVRHGQEQLHQLRHPRMMVEVEEPITITLATAQPIAPPTGSGTRGPLPAVSPTEPAHLPGGTHARLMLLDPLAAGTSEAGDLFAARLEQPIFAGDRLLLPEGAIFTGEVRKVVRPRRLNRPGSLVLAFDNVTLPDGQRHKISASLAGTAMNDNAKAKMDPEGGLHGTHRGAKEMLKDFGIGVVAQQATDEVVELALHSASPYAGAGVGLFFLFGGRGHDVTLPRYSELQIVFNHQVELPVQPLQSDSVPAASRPTLPHPPR